MKIKTKQMIAAGALLLSILLGITIVNQVRSQLAAAKERALEAASTAAIVESKRNAFDLIEALVNHGFRARDGVWTIKLTPKKPVFLELTLFSGNQYWFAAAAALPAHHLKLTLYDATGHSLPLDLWKDNLMVPGARIAGGIVAPHSERYFIGLELIDSQDDARVYGTLVYAYK